MAGEAPPGPAGRRPRPPGVLRDRRAATVVAIGVAVTAAIKFWLAGRISTPWLFSDELVHSELAKNLAGGNLFEIRGERVNISFSYPLVIAPAWLLPSMGETYAAAKVVDVLLVSATALPIYLWSRRFLPWVEGAVVSCIAVLLPELVLTGALMQENLAYPAFVVAAFALALVLESPTPFRQALLLFATVVAATARFELAVLVPIILTAFALYRAPPGRAKVVVISCAGFLVALLLLLAFDSSLLLKAFQTFPQTSATYSAGGLLRWLLWGLGDLALISGIVPLLALPLLRHVEGPAERALLAVTWASVLWFAVLAAVSGSWEPYGLKERYFFYPQPLLFLVLAVWVRRGRRLSLVAGLAVALVTGSVLDRFSPGRLLGIGSIPGNAPGLAFFGSAAKRMTASSFVSVVVVAAVAIALLMTLAAGSLTVRRSVALLACVVVVTCYGFAASLVDSHASAVAVTAALPADHSWVDATAGKSAGVVLLDLASFMPEIHDGDYWTVWAPWWELEFWNRSARSVFGLGSPEPVPLRQTSGTLDWGDGVISGAPAARWVLVDPRFVLAGRRRAASQAFVLYENPGSPLRLRSAEEGVYRDGLSAPSAAYDQWSPVRRGQTVSILLATRPLSRTTRLEVRVGSLVAVGANPAMGRTYLRELRTITGNALISVPVPPAPFRIEVRWLGPSPGYIGFGRS